MSPFFTTPVTPEPPEAVVAFKARHMPQRVADAVSAYRTSERNVATLTRVLDAGEMPDDARRAVQVRIGEDLGRMAFARKYLATIPSRHPLVGGAA